MKTNDRVLLMRRNDIYRDVTRNLRAIQAKIRQITTRAIKIPRNLPVAFEQSVRFFRELNETSGVPVPE